MIEKRLSQGALHTKAFQELLDKKSRDIFNSLKKEVDPDANSLDLDNLRPFLNMYKSHSGLKDSVLKIITSYHLPQKLMNNDLLVDEKLGKSTTVKFTEEEFSNFITGKEIKSLLFEKNIDEKRQNVEDIYALYTLMGGDRDGISVDNLNKSISKVIALYSKPEEYLRENYNPESEAEKFKGEAQEIINLLSQSKTDKLSLEDFVNIMTSEFLAEFDLMTLESLDFKR